MLGGAAVVFAVYYEFAVDLTTALLVASGAAIVLYIIGCAAGVRLRPTVGSSARPLRWLPAISLAISLVVLPFIGWPVLVTVAVVAAAVTYGLVISARRPNVPGA